MSIVAAPTISYSWNVFRYLADYLHAFGVLAVILTLFVNRNCRGLSLKTQLFYMTIFFTRYLDIFSQISHPIANHSIYLIVFKLFYILSSVVIVYFMMWRWRSTIETNKDTCSVAFVIIPCIIISLFSTIVTSFTMIKFLWTFSEILEGFAMLPQYIFIYRQEEENKRSDKKIFLFIVLVGTYRCFYAINWIYKKIMLGSAYHDGVSWFAGIIEISLFLDFLFNKNFLKIIVLSLDTRVNSITNNIELKAVSAGSSGQHSPNGIRKRKTGLDLDEDEAMLII